MPGGNFSLLNKTGRLESFQAAPFCYLESEKIDQGLFDLGASPQNSRIIVTMNRRSNSPTRLSTIPERSNWKTAAAIKSKTIKNPMMGSINITLRREPGFDGRGSRPVYTVSVSSGSIENLSTSPGLVKYLFPYVPVN